MPTEESQNHKQSSTKSAASVPTITQLLRYVGTEMVAMPDGSVITRQAMIAKYLWDIAQTKQVQLTNGTIITATNNEWLGVVYHIIERLEGKPIQAIDATVRQGIILNRNTRAIGKAAVDGTLDPEISISGTLKE